MTIDDNEGEHGVGSEYFTAPEQIVEDEPAAETGENGTGEEGEQQPEEEAEQPETEEESEPQAKSVQERINEITAKRREAERLADERARDAEYWRGVAEGRIAPPQQQQAEPSDGKPDPNGYEFGEADPRYIEDLTDWKVDQKLEKTLTERDQRQQVTAQLDKLEQTYTANVEKTREEIPDYDDKVTKTAARGEWPCPPVVALAAKESDVGPKVLYHLATNREEAVAISQLSPIEQAIAFGRLEGRFLNQPETPKPNIATNAPEPPQQRTKGGQFAPSGRLDDRQSQEDWLRARNAQLAQQRGR